MDERKIGGEGKKVKEREGGRRESERWGEGRKAKGRQANTGRKVDERAK